MNIEPEIDECTSKFSGENWLRGSEPSTTQGMDTRSIWLWNQYNKATTDEKMNSPPFLSDQTPPPHAIPEMVHTDFCSPQCFGHPHHRGYRPPFHPQSHQHFPPPPYPPHSHHSFRPPHHHHHHPPHHHRGHHYHHHKHNHLHKFKATYDFHKSAFDYQTHSSHGFYSSEPEKVDSKSKSSASVDPALCKKFQQEEVIPPFQHSHEKSPFSKFTPSSLFSKEMPSPALFSECIKHMMRHPPPPPPSSFPESKGAGDLPLYGDALTDHVHSNKDSTSPSVSRNRQEEASSEASFPFSFHSKPLPRSHSHSGSLNKSEESEESSKRFRMEVDSEVAIPPHKRNRSLSQINEEGCNSIDRFNSGLYQTKPAPEPNESATQRGGQVNEVAINSLEAGGVSSPSDRFSANELVKSVVCKSVQKMDTVLDGGRHLNLSSMDVEMQRVLKSQPSVSRSNGREGLMDIDLEKLPSEHIKNMQTEIMKYVREETERSIGMEKSNKHNNSNNKKMMLEKALGFEKVRFKKEEEGKEKKKERGIRDMFESNSKPSCTSTTKEKLYNPFDLFTHGDGLKDSMNKNEMEEVSKDIQSKNSVLSSSSSAHPSLTQHESMQTEIMKYVREETENMFLCLKKEKKIGKASPLTVSKSTSRLDLPLRPDPNPNPKPLPKPTAKASTNLQADPKLIRFLNKLGLSSFISCLAEAWVDMKELPDIPNADLKEMGLTEDACVRLSHGLLKYKGGRDEEMEGFIESVGGLSPFLPLFSNEYIFMEDLYEMSEDELLSLGLPMGPCKRLLRALNRVKRKQERMEVKDIVCLSEKDRTSTSVDHTLQPSPSSIPLSIHSHLKSIKPSYKKDEKDEKDRAGCRDPPNSTDVHSSHSRPHPLSLPSPFTLNGEDRILQQLLPRVRPSSPSLSMTKSVMSMKHIAEVITAAKMVSDKANETSPVDSVQPVVADAASELASAAKALVDLLQHHRLTDSN